MNRLKKLREENNLTQQELSDRLGVSKRTLGYWEKEENLQLKPNKAKKIANFFDVSVSYLLGYPSGIKDRLTELRLEKGLSVEQVAKDLKISEDEWLTLVTTDNYNLSEGLAREIANYFEVSISYLLGKTDIPQKYDDEVFVDLPGEAIFYSMNRIDDENFNKFINFCKEINIVLTDKQAKYIFELIKTMDFNETIENIENIIEQEVDLVTISDDDYYKNLHEAGYNLLNPKE